MQLSPDVVYIVTGLATSVAIFAAVMGLRERSRRRREDHDVTVTLEIDGTTKVYKHLSADKYRTIVAALESSAEGHHTPRDSDAVRN